MLHGHGNDRYRFENKIVADFSSNVWFKPLPESFFLYLKNVFKSVIDYPHPEAGDLKKNLSEFYTIPRNNIWVTNGSMEGIYLLAQLFAKKKSAIIFPCFSEYECACLRYEHNLSFYSNKSNFKNRLFNEDVIWIGNPNNPDGHTISVSEVENLLLNNPGSTFIIDETYAGVTINFCSSYNLLRKYKNLIILRSFTKTFAIPGIRLGYLFAPKLVIQKLAELSIPWSVNTLAIEAGKFIIQHHSELSPLLTEMVELNKKFHKKLTALVELEVYHSQSNFFLVRLKKGEAAELKSFMINRYGILIRDASNFRGLNDRYIRLSIQSKKDIELLIAALKSYFNELS